MRTINFFRCTFFLNQKRKKHKATFSIYFFLHNFFLSFFLCSLMFKQDLKFQGIKAKTDVQNFHIGRKRKLPNKPKTNYYVGHVQWARCLNLETDGYSFATQASTHEMLISAARHKDNQVNSAINNAHQPEHMGWWQFKSCSFIFTHFRV